MTETLYALAVQQTPAFIPDEIHLITTQEGAHRARLSLLEPETGAFYRLCDQYGIDASRITFADAQIHVIRDQDTPLDDIRTPKQNEMAADMIVNIIRELTADPDSVIHASIAGGRKTMGFYLGYAMSLLGRARDQLSHVLVSQPFENHREFFFPPKTPEVLHVHPGDRPVRTDDARIMLASIPFVRLRDTIDKSVLGEGMAFSSIVRVAQSHLQPLTLELDLMQRSATVAGHRFRLNPADFALYAWYALRKKRGDEPLKRLDIENTPSAELRQIYLHTADVTDEDDNRVLKALNENFELTYMDQRRSSLNKALEKQLGASLANRVKIVTAGKRPYTGATLALPAEAIQIINVPRELKNLPGLDTSN